MLIINLKQTNVIRENLAVNEAATEREKVYVLWSAIGRKSVTQSTLSLTDFVFNGIDLSCGNLFFYFLK